ncbi:hypothetical protein [Maribacter confluentis]
MPQWQNNIVTIVLFNDCLSTMPIRSILIIYGQFPSAIGFYS